MPWTDIFDAWAGDDAAERADLVAGLTVAEVYYADPHTGPINGQQGLLEMIAGFRAMVPDGSAVSRDGDGYAGHARAAVEFRRAGKTFMTGQYFARLDDAGRITHLIGFAGPPTP
jgi:hypothetical protein